MTFADTFAVTLSGLAILGLTAWWLWAANRPLLGCGCLNDGRGYNRCLTCGLTRCYEHRGLIHNCNLTRERPPVA